jgi:DNA-binding MarR family transcriptional regulator
MIEISEEDRRAVGASGRRSGSMLQIHEAFMKRPIMSAGDLVERTNLTAPTVNASIEALAQMGLIKEITGKKRGRLFVYDRYLSTLDRGVG